MGAYFTEPSIMPLTKYFWMKGYTMMMGMVVTMVAAMRMLSGVMDWLIRLAAAAPAS